MATVPETIRRAREQMGLSPQEVAERIRMNVPSYFDLEATLDDWEHAVHLGQLLELSRILDTPLLELLGEHANEVSSPLSFPEMAELILEQIAERRIVAANIGWDLSDFWNEPMFAMEYPLLFLQIVGDDVGFDWRRPVLFYQ
jgi:transcriptional regulator with XRE-family HTH domain